MKKKFDLQKIKQKQKIYVQTCHNQKKKKEIYLVVLGFSCGMCDLVPQSGIKPWECRVLATGPPGKSPDHF